MNKRVLIIFALFFSTVVFSEDYGTIKGKVLFENELPFPGVNIRFNGKKELNTVTDENGEYTIENAPAGKYKATAGRFLTYTDIENITISKNKLNTINFNLKSPVSDGRPRVSSLIGVVLDKANGSPIQNARLVISNDSKMLGAESTVKGVYFFEQIQNEVINLTCEAEGYKINALVRLILTPGSIKRVDIELEKEPDLISRTFNFNYRHPKVIIQQINDTIAHVGQTTPNSDNSLLIKTTSEKMKKVESIIKQYDIPLKQIWLEVRLIYASNDATTKNSLPKEIEPISKQLQTLFRYSNYELLDNAKIQAIEDSPCQFSSGKGMYKIAIRKIEFVAVNGGLLKLQNIELLKKGENSPILATSVNIPNGDTLILGASSTDASGKALITAVTAKILN